MKNLIGLDNSKSSYPCNFNYSEGKATNRVKMYGNSTQNGTPTPTAQIDIQNVGDMSVNLFNEELLFSNKYIEKTDYGFVINAYAVSFVGENDPLVKSVRDSLTPGTYTFSKNYLSPTSASSGQCQIRSETGVIISTSPYNGFTSNTYTLTQEQIDSITRIYIYGSNNGGQFAFVQLQKGSTFTQHELFGKYQITINQSSKNLFNKEYFKNYSNYITYYNNYRYTAPINLKPNTTYTISPTSFNNLGASFYYVAWFSETFSNDYIRYPVSAGVPKTVTFTTTSEGIVKFGISSNENLNTIFDNISFQLEEGLSATNYVDYKEPKNEIIYLNSPINKIENKIDYIDFERQKVVRNTEKYVFTGDENFLYASAYTNSSRALFYNTSLKLGSDKVLNGIPVMCSHFVKTTAYRVGDTEVGVSINNSYVSTVKSIAFFVPIGLCELNVTAFKAWLKSQYDNGTPVTIEYQIDVSEEDIVLNPIQTFKGLNSITNNNNVNLSNIDITYKSKIKNYNIFDGNWLNYNTSGGNLLTTNIYLDNNSRGYLVEVEPNITYSVNIPKNLGIFRCFLFTDNPVLNTSLVSVGGTYSDKNTSMTVTATSDSKYCYVLVTRDATNNQVTTSDFYKLNERN